MLCQSLSLWLRTSFRVVHPLCLFISFIHSLPRNNCSNPRNLPWIGAAGDDDDGSQGMDATYISFSTVHRWNGWSGSCSLDKIISHSKLWYRFQASFYQTEQFEFINISYDQSTIISTNSRNISIDCLNDWSDLYVERD
eukprot:406566_1